MLLDDAEDDLVTVLLGDVERRARMGRDHFLLDHHRVVGGEAYDFNHHPSGDAWIGGGDREAEIVLDAGMELVE